MISRRIRGYGLGCKIVGPAAGKQRFFLALGWSEFQFCRGRNGHAEEMMKARDRAAQKNRPSGGAKKPAKPASAPKRIAATKKVAPAKKPSVVMAMATKPASPAVAAKPAPQLATAVVAARPVAAKPQAPKPAMTPGQQATAQQADERRKAATRKLFARIRSLEAILGADLRKRGSLLLSQAVDQWYAEATSATATDVSITNAARAVISQL